MGPCPLVHSLRPLEAVNLPGSRCRTLHAKFRVALVDITRRLLTFVDLGSSRAVPHDGGSVEGEMATKFPSPPRDRAALLDEWGRLTTLVEIAEKNPPTEPPELVTLWRQLFGLCEQR